MQPHPAPFSTLLRIVSAAGSLILLGGAATLYLAPPPVPRWLALLPLSVLAACLLFTVRGYTIDGRTLLIHRLLWSTRLSLDGLQSARVEPGAMRGSLRLFGNGGLFSFSGLYRNAHLGSYRAWVTDLKLAVVLRFPDRTWVVSPADPEAFVRQAQGGRPPA